MDFEGQKSTASIDDASIVTNGSTGHDNDGHDLNADSSEHIIMVPNKEAEELNPNDQEDGSLHSNRSTSGDYVDAVSLVSSVEKGAVGSLGSPGTSPPSSGAKGKGLRKWRRIRREFVKDGGLNKDSAKVLKRGSADLANPKVSIAEMKQKGGGPESSVNELLCNFLNEVFSVDGFGSESSVNEDRNSRSSTVANVPIPRPSGQSRDKNKTIGKYPVNASQRMQQGLSNVDASKKHRGEAAINLDKESPLSSPESDSGSYNSTTFMHCPSDGITNGKSDRGAGYDGEHGDSDGPAGGHESVEELPVGPSTSVEDEEILQGDAVLSWKLTGRVKSHQISGNWDPLVGCVHLLQSTQNALEQELQKFGELGKGLQPFDDDVIRTPGAGLEFCAASSSDPPTYEEFGMEIPDVLRAKIISLTKNAKILEKQAEQAMSMLKEKETKIVELHAVINNLKASNEHLGRSIDVQQKKNEELEAEGDALFKLKMEAEIQHIAVSDSSIVTENRMKLLITEHKFLVSAQEEEMSKVANLERRAADLKYKAEVGLAGRKGTAGAEKRIPKFTFCFIIQLILLFFMFQSFKSQFLPKTTVVLPT